MIALFILALAISMSSFAFGAGWAMTRIARSLAETLSNLPKEEFDTLVEEVHRKRQVREWKKINKEV